MAIRSGGRLLSFGLLAGSSSGDDYDLSPSSRMSAAESAGVAPPSPRRRRKTKPSKRKKKAAASLEGDGSLSFSADDLSPHSRCYDPAPPGGVDVSLAVSQNRSVVLETVCESAMVEPAPEREVACVSFVELRQRSVGVASAADGSAEEKETASGTPESSVGSWVPAPDGDTGRLGKEVSLDWNQVIAEDPSLIGEIHSLDKSPLKYFMGEIYGGNSLRSTISAGNEKKRQGVYNTMFHVPWRCERLIIAGFFVCLDSFLSLLTIMPARIVMAVWRLLRTRKFWRPNSAELCDFGCFLVLASGVASLQLADISLIYHFIRGQGTIKLYVVYNVLEIFDKLCQSFGEDVLQVLFDSAEGLSNCPLENMAFQLTRFFCDELIAVVAFVLHSFILLAQAVTLSTCIIAHNNALMALLVSNNFSEIKSNVFKRFSKENLHSMVYFDIIERFHITAFLLFVLAQNILEAEGHWFQSFLSNALQVYICEIFVDAIKHSFLAKFNEIKPMAYSEFLEDLCKQTLKEKPDEHGKDLTFIPLAPACVVIRVLAPVYALPLPYGPLPWRLFWIFFWSGLTYVILAICKILVGLSIRRFAAWYINLRLHRKQHVD